MTKLRLTITFENSVDALLDVAQIKEALDKLDTDKESYTIDVHTFEEYNGTHLPNSSHKRLGRRLITLTVTDRLRKIEAHELTTTRRCVVDAARHLCAKDPANCLFTRKQLDKQTKVFMEQRGLKPSGSSAAVSQMLNEGLIVTVKSDPVTSN